MLFYLGSILIIIMLKKNRYFFIYNTLPLLLAFIVSLLPVIGIISLGSIDHADRYSYIPSVFIWFSFGLILTRILYKKDYFYTKFKRTFLLNRNFIFFMLLLYSVSLIILTCLYQKNWESNYILFSYASNYYPSANIGVLIVLAETELKKGNYEEALVIAEKLKQKNKDSSMAVFVEASVMFHFDKKSAIKIMVIVFI